jgi:DNA-binding MarR family transcriptional regulator
LHSTRLVDVKDGTDDGFRAAPRDDVAALEHLTRTLVGITLASLDALDGALSVPRFRALLALDALGRVPSSRLAAEIGTAASSVTRLVDRLEAAGYARRGVDPANRGIVTVEATAAGRVLVTAVLARRYALLEAVLDRLEPDAREAARVMAGEITRIAREAGMVGMVGSTGPVPP